MLSSLLSFLLAASANSQMDQRPWKLKPFTTDGCTLIAGGTKAQPHKWEHCCVQHDLAYWAGGSWSERREADLAWKRCLKEAGEGTLGFFGYLGLRVAGTALLPTPFRWAYGWTGVRGYWSLNEEEKALVKNLTPPKLSQK